MIIKEQNTTSYFHPLHSFSHSSSLIYKYKFISILFSSILYPRLTPTQIWLVKYEFWLIKSNQNNDTFLIKYATWLIPHQSLVVLGPIPIVIILLVHIHTTVSPKIQIQMKRSPIIKNRDLDDKFDLMMNFYLFIFSYIRISPPIKYIPFHRIIVWFVISIVDWFWLLSLSITQTCIHITHKT